MTQRRRASVVDVLAPVAVDTAYSYRAPLGIKLEPGAFVRMPLGARVATGVVWATRESGGDNLKSIVEVLDWPPIRPPLRDFIDWTARWTLAPRGMLLRMAIRAGEVAEPPAPKLGLVATGKAPTRMTEARARVLAALAESGAPTPKAALAARAACSTSVIDGLVADGALEVVALASESVAAALDPDFHSVRLNADQRAAADDLIRLVADRVFSTTLLEGVTGSGKTEVYFEAVAEALRQKRQALVLLPEIALTAQFLDRFAARFGARPGRMAFRLDRAPARTRLDGGCGRRGSGRCRRTLGALSAVRRPRPHRRRRGARGRLQTRGGRHLQRARHGGGARAVRESADRAGLGDAGDRDPVQRRKRTLPLAPASLSLRSGAAARHRPGRPQARRSAARPMAVAARNRRRRGGEGPRASRRCCSSTGAAMRRSRCAGPAAIASNAPIARPGWSSTDFAPRSFAIIAAMSRAGHSSVRNATRPTRSPPAGRASSVWPRRRKPSFPTYARSSCRRIRRAGSRRCAASSTRRRTALSTSSSARSSSPKGTTFPLLTFVCIVDADVGLANADPRAAERTFQLLRQATGRAGRGEKLGHALLQTWQPEHPVIAALISGDAERFYREETEQRRLGGLPPFGRLAAIIVSAEDRGAAEAHARALARAAHNLPSG